MLTTNFNIKDMFFFLFLCLVMSNQYCLLGVTRFHNFVCKTRLIMLSAIATKIYLKLIIVTVEHLRVRDGKFNSPAGLVPGP